MIKKSLFEKRKGAEKEIVYFLLFSLKINRVVERVRARERGEERRGMKGGCLLLPCGGIDGARGRRWRRGGGKQIRADEGGGDALPAVSPLAPHSASSPA